MASKSSKAMGPWMKFFLWASGLSIGGAVVYRVITGQTPPWLTMQGYYVDDSGRLFDVNGTLVDPPVYVNERGAVQDAFGNTFGRVS